MEQEQDIKVQLEILEGKIDYMQKTVSSLRKYFMISTIINVIFFVLPLIIAIVALPFMINTFSSMYGGLI